MRPGIGIPAASFVASFFFSHQLKVEAYLAAGSIWQVTSFHESHPIGMVDEDQCRGASAVAFRPDEITRTER